MVNRYVELVADLLSPSRSISERLFTLKDLESNELQTLASKVLMLLPPIISSTWLVSRVERLLSGDDVDDTRFRESFSQTLKTTLQFSEDAKNLDKTGKNPCIEIRMSAPLTVIFSLHELIDNCQRSTSPPLYGRICESHGWSS